MRISGALARVASGQRPRGRTSRDESGVGVVVFGNMCFACACACAVEWDQVKRRRWVFLVFPRYSERVKKSQMCEGGMLMQSHCSEMFNSR
jgi:hypothetical protein